MPVLGTTHTPRAAAASWRASVCSTDVVRSAQVEEVDALLHAQRGERRVLAARPAADDGVAAAEDVVEGREVARVDLKRTDALPPVGDGLGERLQGARAHVADLDEVHVGLRGEVVHDGRADGPGPDTVMVM